MSLITLIGVVVFVSLGNWQLERAAYKRAIVDRFENRLNSDFVVFNQAEALHEMEYRRVILAGQYDFQRTFLLDNQLSKGRAGFHVISPFAPRQRRCYFGKPGLACNGKFPAAVTSYKGTDESQRDKRDNSQACF